MTYILHRYFRWSFLIYYGITRPGLFRIARHPDFYKTRQWATVRWQALQKHGHRCQGCGRSVKDGAVLCVDHVLPRLKYPWLCLSLSNMGCLCRTCNRGKADKVRRDYRR